MSLSNITQKVLSAAKGCSNYFDSYANWFTRKLEKTTDSYNVIINAINDPENYISNETASQISIFLDGNVTSLSSICQNLVDNDNRYIVSGVDRSIQLVDSIKSEYQSNVLYQKAFDVLSTVYDEKDASTQFLLRTQSLDLSDSCSSLRSYIADVFGNERLDMGAKATTLVKDLSLNNNVSDPVERIFTSSIFEATGTHPAILWAVNTFDIDYAELANKIEGVLLEAFSAIGQLALGFLITLAKTDRWLRSKWNTYVVEGGPIFTTNTYGTRHFDNTCEQMFFQLRFPTTNIGKEALATDLGIPLTAVNSIYNICDGKPLVKIDTPFACIYIGHFDGILGDTLMARVYPKYVSTDDFNSLGLEAFNWGKISTIEEVIGCWQGYSGSNTIQNISEGQNKSFIYGFNYGHRYLNYWGYALANEYFSLGKTAVQVYALNGEGTYLDNTWNTNKQALESCHYLYPNGGSTPLTSSGSYNSSLDAYILNMPNVNDCVKGILMGIAAYCDIAYNDYGYAPYTVENNFYPSTFSLKNDEELIDQYWNMIKAVGYTAIAITAIAVTAKVTKNIKLAYQSSEVAYWNAINSGDAQGAVKAARKSKMLSGLAGAASASSSSAITVTSDANAIQTVIKLIAG